MELCVVGKSFGSNRNDLCPMRERLKLVSGVEMVLQQVCGVIHENTCVLMWFVWESCYCVCLQMAWHARCARLSRHNCAAKLMQTTWRLNIAHRKRSPKRRVMLSQRRGTYASGGANSFVRGRGHNSDSYMRRKSASPAAHSQHSGSSTSVLARVVAANASFGV